MIVLPALLALSMLSAADSAALAADLMAPDDVERSVLEAHAAAREGRNDAARSLYLAAAQGLPSIGDWLRLRAARLTPDSATRAQLYGELSNSAARDRVTLIEATVLERNGNSAAAAAQYEAAGRLADAFRVRLTGATQADRATIRAQLLDRLTASSSANSAALAALYLATYADLSASEQLILTRVTLRGRETSAAARLCPGALQATEATPSDSLDCAGAMITAGEYRGARLLLPALLRAPEHRAAAQYQAARLTLRTGTLTEARNAFIRFADQHPRDSLAPGSLLLAGELAWRARAPATAHRAWKRVGTEYPASRAAGRARFLDALLDWEAGHIELAAMSWEALFESGGSDALAAGYWAGRAWSKLGRPDRAREFWNAVWISDPLSYYAVASSKRLGVPVWQPGAGAAISPPTDTVRLAIDRVKLLERVQMDDEATSEREWLLRTSPRDAESLLSLADALRQSGEAATALRLSFRIGTNINSEPRVVPVLFPLAYDSTLARLSRETGIDQAVLAGLIRQESSWNPLAVSRAGARGLMQLMPRTAEMLHDDDESGPWTVDLLADPATNLRMGTTHLADMLRAHHGDLIRTLAAYNAGAARVRAWDARIPNADPELFLERIGFDETRNYVRLVLRNAAFYGVLYPS